MSDSQEKLSNREPFYKKGEEYWSHIEPTVNGMLGGFSQLSVIDTKASKRFLNQYFPLLEELNAESRLITNFKNKRCLDCGAGIGRVTKNLLLNFFECADMLEQNQKFLEAAKEYIGEDVYKKRIGKTYACSLHKFQPDPSIKYDLIWCQWVTGHLTDTDFVAFLKICKSVLNPEHGLIVLKENHTSNDECDSDMKDSSITRPYWLLIDIFKNAGLQVVSERRQYKFPKGLYPVKMFALK
ncbi:N-terminal Xaa-Pro-Lys N-methyltransferase 1-like protein [Leptotrombidium deliense]|uniref:Alpha N-terminal protein methyltransferase 1 n=1 Tax=Leptotrombidium deliense TaxID=299467 RepID=A0A443SWN0_9ACAR|nr:N-terminal Xaa-Pro-Lys N-methyltransferase 1-like protein [Leptotrombidium deliense]